MQEMNKAIENEQNYVVQSYIRPDLPYCAAMASHSMMKMIKPIKIGLLVSRSIRSAIMMLVSQKQCKSNWIQA